MNPKLRKPLIITVTVFAMLTALMGTGGASGTEPSNGSTSDEIVFVPRSTPLHGAATVTEPGVVENGECLIQGSLEGEGGNTRRKLTSRPPSHR